MATHRWNRIVNTGVIAMACLGGWSSLVQSEPPQRALPARPLNAAPAAPQMGAAQKMQPLQPLKPIPKADPAEDPQTNGCIVLGDGRVFQGVLSELPEAYQVKTKTGVVVLPFTQVRTVAASLSEAYEQLRDSYTKPSTSDHIDLGRWCLQNELFEEASIEAQAALVLEPTRKEAITLLKRAEAALGQPIESPVETPPEVTPAGPVAAAALVSPEAQLEFNRHIQRLAFNKCGNGNCHGASALSSFKLIRNARNEVNLQAVLKYVDPDNPEMSPLLVKARSVDGAHNGLFLGTSGTEQYARIQAWVIRVSQEQGQLAGTRRRSEPSRKSGPVVMIRPKEKQPIIEADGETDDLSDTSNMALDTAPDIDVSPAIETTGAEEANPVSRGLRREREAPLKSEAIQKLLQSQEPDAFDPDEFNQMVHGDQPK